MGSPSGFAILQYTGADESHLPDGAIPQPGSVEPWNPAQAAMVSPPPDTLDSGINWATDQTVGLAPDPAVALEKPCPYSLQRSQAW